MEHSKTPWKIGAMESGQAAIDSADGKEVTGFIDMEDARRILVCVNAMAGIDDDNVLFRRGSVGTVRKHIVTQQVKIEKLTAQRNELLAVLESIIDLHDSASRGKQVAETISKARAVIQKVRGGEC